MINTSQIIELGIQQMLEIHNLLWIKTVQKIKSLIVITDTGSSSPCYLEKFHISDALDSDYSPIN